MTGLIGAESLTTARLRGDPHAARARRSTPTRYQPAVLGGMLQTPLKMPQFHFSDPSTPWKFVLLERHRNM